PGAVFLHELHVEGSLFSRPSLHYYVGFAIDQYRHYTRPPFGSISARLLTAILVFGVMKILTPASSRILFASSWKWPCIFTVIRRSPASCLTETIPLAMSARLFMPP